MFLVLPRVLPVLLVSDFRGWKQLAASWLDCRIKYCAFQCCDDGNDNDDEDGSHYEDRDDNEEEEEEEEENDDVDGSSRHCDAEDAYDDYLMTTTTRMTIITICCVSLGHCFFTLKAEHGSFLQCSQ